MSISKTSRQTAVPRHRMSPEAAMRSLLSGSWPKVGRLLVLLVWAAFLLGCGGSPGIRIPAQALPQGPSDKEELQKKILLQASRASLANYKDYRVGPEDLLVIDVYGQDKLKRELRVNGQGFISMPLVGPVKVAGLTTQEIQEQLEKLYGADFLRNPQVTVEVKEYHHQRVAVTGAVDKPGSYEIIGPRTLLEVLAMAGGFSGKPRAEPGDVIHVIRRQSAATKTASLKGKEPETAAPPTSQTIVIDLRKLVSGQAPELNLTVESGDVVHVPFAGTAHVLGGVKKPGNVTVKEKLTVSQAVAMAGGIDPLLGTKNITIMRFDQQGKPIAIETNLNDITSQKDPDIPIQENDVIVVKEGEFKKKIWVIRQVLPIPSGGYSIPTQ